MERKKSVPLTDKMRKRSIDEPPYINIMLLGSTGSGKSASGNTIIGVRETFKEDLSPESVTRTCESAQTELDGQTITVIDTVGLSDTSVNITDAQTQIEKILHSTRDGVDVFLLVIKLSETFKDEVIAAVKWIQKIFGAKFSNHTIVLFTHGDLLHEPIEDYLGECETLRSVVDQCSGGFHVFNNKNEDRSQVTELLEKIESLRRKNAYKRYTEQDYKQTQRALLLKICAAAAAAAGGLAVVAAAGVVASMMGTASTAEQAAVIGAAGGATGGLASTMGVGVAAAGVAMMRTAEQSSVIGAAGGLAVAVLAVAVGAGVYFLSRKYSSKEKDKSN